MTTIISRAAKKDLIPNMVVRAKCDGLDAPGFEAVFKLNAAKGGNLMISEEPKGN